MAAWREPRTLLIGLLVLVLAFTEGTANDWVALAFIDGHAFDPAMGALGAARQQISRVNGSILRALAR